MRYYTKEWYTLMQRLGTADLFEPVLDKEYSDEEIEEMYQEMLEKYVQEEHDSYDEPPFFILDPEEDIASDEFDPEDFLVGDIDENGEEFNLRHPETLDEFLDYQKREMEQELAEYENRPPFDEEEARREFEENYQDSLEEPDEDIPQWIRDTVDPRLLAMWVLPEGAYKKLAAEEEELQERFDELDEAAEEALEEVPVEEAREEEAPAEEPEEEEIQDENVKYNLDEIQEYIELKTAYDNLQTQFNAMKADYDELVEFKKVVDRKEKQEMIDRFYMLSDEEKKDVIENIDNYSVDDIEAKLSVICVRNKVSFDLDTDEEEKQTKTTFNLDDHVDDDVTPAWIKAALLTKKEME